MPKKLRRYRVLSVNGPFDRGVLNQFHDYVVEVELDPVGHYAAVTAKVVVTFFDTAFFAISAGAWGSDPGSEQVKARVAHFVIEQLAGFLPTPSAEIPKSMTPTKEDVLNLRQIDLAKIAVKDWHVVPELVPLNKRRVFISCGQHSEAELALGKKVADMVKEATGLDGYFAENQQSLEGVTHNIFNALYNSCGFIAIMHRRDEIPASTAEFRASVWVEQEVAIAAFLVQALGLSLPCRVYMQKGIRREGVRGFILLNPVEFEASDQILQDLQGFLPMLPNVLGT